MAKVDKQYGEVLYQYFSISRGCMVANTDQGITLVSDPYSIGWKVRGRKKETVSMAEWLRVKQTQYEAVPEWAKQCKSMPTLATLERWEREGVCRTPTGHMVEPDGEGPDGVPSWLRVLRVI